MKVQSIDRDTHYVVTFLKRGKSTYDFGFLIWQEKGFLRLEVDLSLVLFRNFPLILERNSCLILN